MRVEKGVKLTVALFATFLIAPATSPAQQTSGCLSYEPDVVRLEGTVIRKTFPGPPYYESVKHGDRPEVAWLLVLSEPICMREDTNDSATNIAQTGIREIQIGFVEGDGYKKYKSLIKRKKRVVATGTLFGSHTGHHHTPVLMTVKALNEATEH
jgi:Domain of unknown function (DUF4431)